MYEGVRQILARAVGRWLAREGLDPAAAPPLHLGRPPSPGMGDYSSGAAMELARAARRPAPDVARELAAMAEDPDGLLAGPPAVAGKGFVNFTVRPARWFALARDVLAHGEGKLLESARGAGGGGGRSVLVEFVSANPTGPLHVGHGRGAVTGDALVRILGAAGWRSATEYYVNDRGRQVAELGRSVHCRYRQLFDPSFPDPEGENWYRGEYVRDVARALQGARGDALLGEAASAAVFRDFGVERLLAHIEEDLACLGIRFDRWFRETGMPEAVVRGAVDDLVGRGLAKVNEDGVSVSFTGGGEGSGDEKERVLVKSTGEYTYFGTDVPYHNDKLARGFDLLINVWGADHHGYVPRMKAALKAFGHDPERLKVVLVQMVSLTRGGVPVKMAKRAGEFVTLRELVDEVGRDAFRFIFLTRRSDSQLDFDIEAAKKKNMDNPVFHVQYGHARLCSILKRAERWQQKGAALTALEGGADMMLDKYLTLPGERAILADALRLGEAVGDAARTLQPHRVAVFLMDLSKALQTYYTRQWRVHRDPVLPPASTLGTSGDLPEGWNDLKMYARLHWIKVLQMSMRAALGLIGVDAPERMERAGQDDEEQAEGVIRDDEHGMVLPP